MGSRSYQETPALPLALKIAAAVFLLVWVPIYWAHNGPANFLWLCDLANFLVVVGIWLESPALISSQAVGVLLVQVVWAIDFCGRLLWGRHPIGGTEYMFDVAEPLLVRGLSLFHLLMPALLLWLVRRLGYDRRGLWIESGVVWVVLPICYLFTDPALNLNWLVRPFNAEQQWLSPGAYLGFALLTYPLVLFLPVHLALSAWRGGRRGGDRLVR